LPLLHKTKAPESLSVLEMPKSFLCSPKLEGVLKREGAKSDGRRTGNSPKGFTRDLV